MCWRCNYLCDLKQSFFAILCGSWVRFCGAVVSQSRGRRLSRLIRVNPSDSGVCMCHGCSVLPSSSPPFSSPPLLLLWLFSDSAAEEYFPLQGLPPTPVGAVSLETMSELTRGPQMDCPLSGYTIGPLKRGSLPF